jgi:hypothetical protein
VKLVSVGNFRAGAVWKYVHGPTSKPPPAGPNAVAGPDAADGDD